MNTKNLTIFFALTLLLAFGVGSLVASSPRSAYSFPNIVFMIIFTFTPTISAVALIRFRHPKEEQYIFLKSLYDIKAIRLKWLVVILLFSPLLDFLALLIEHLISGRAWSAAPDSQILHHPAAYLLYSIPIFITVLGEEIGWRGYAQRFMAVMPVPISGLIIGVIWAIWHLPLFFIPGLYQHRLGLLTTDFFIFMGDTAMLAIVFAAIFVKTGNSTLSAVLLHFMVNMDPVGDLFLYSTFTRAIKSFLLLLVSLTIVFGIRMSRAEPKTR
jgi:hypothetical protein